MSLLNLALPKHTYSPWATPDRSRVRFVCWRGRPVDVVVIVVVVVIFTVPIVLEMRLRAWANEVETSLAVIAAVQLGEPAQLCEEVSTTIWIWLLQEFSFEGFVQGMFVVGRGEDHMFQDTLEGE